jgi:hypothetical protein
MSSYDLHGNLLPLAMHGMTFDIHDLELVRPKQNTCYQFAKSAELSLVLLHVLRLWIADTILVDCKHAIAFWKTGTVVDFTYSRLASTFLET